MYQIFENSYFRTELRNLHCCETFLLCLLPHFCPFWDVPSYRTSPATQAIWYGKKNMDIGFK